MGIEDSDVHARRNVLLLSTSMLLAAWLNQDLPGVLAALGISSIRLDLAERVWAALFVVVLYLLARYHFSPTRSERWADGAGVVRALQYRFLKRWVLRSFVNEINAQRLEKSSTRSLITGEGLGIQWLAVVGWREIHFQYRHEEEDDKSFNNRYDNDTSESGKLPRWVALVNHSASFIVRMLLSRDGLEVAVPYWLAIVAVGVAAQRAGWL